MIGDWSIELWVEIGDTGRINLDGSTTTFPGGTKWGGTASGHGVEALADQLEQLAAKARSDHAKEKEKPE